MVAAGCGRGGWGGAAIAAALWKPHRATGLWVAAGFTDQSVCMRRGLAQQQSAAWQAQLQAAGEWRRESGGGRVAAGGGGGAAAGFSAPPAAVAAVVAAIPTAYKQCI